MSSSDDDALGWPALGGIALAMVSLPAHLWRLYVEYLWDPAPGSWVSRTAYTFRILAYLMIAPFCLLTLVDVTSYVIARTLGVVETTRASTDDKVAITIEELASAGVSAGAVRGSDVGEDEEESGRKNAGDAQFNMKIELDGTQHQQAPSSLSPQAGPSAYFFNPSEEKNLDLSGANILSPAVSRQGSPGVERRRRELAPVMISEDRVGGEHDADGYFEDGSASASASTDSFAVVDHEPLVASDAEASSSTGLRRRAGVSEENAGTQVQQQQ